MRASDIFGSDLKLVDAIDINKVEDSVLKGCHLYSALASLAEYPTRLVKIFNAKEPNSFGAYSVNLLVSGIPLEIIVDDFFPVKNADKKDLLFSQPKN